MSLDLLKKAIGESSLLCEEICFHLMGEPSLHPQLREAFDLASSCHAKVNFTTNGVLIKRISPVLIAAKALRQINFSIHSLVDSCPKGSDILEDIFSFARELRNTRSNVFINFRWWRSQEDSTSSALSKICSFYGIKEISINPGEKSLRLGTRTFLHFESPFTWPSLSGPLLQTSGFCHALSKQFGILADGRVVPCCLDREGVMALGNINEESLECILASKEASGMREGFRRKELVADLCKHCSYIGRFN
jgi:radical SAM protein with 4Fe4S-binding SPASM domain